MDPILTASGADLSKFVLIHRIIAITSNWRIAWIEQISLQIWLGPRMGVFGSGSGVIHNALLQQDNPDSSQKLQKSDSTPKAIK